MSNQTPENKVLLELEDILKELNSTSVGRRAFLASVPILMAACASDNHRSREGDNSGQETQLTVADEKKMTQEALPMMRKDYPPLQDAEAQRYIGNLGSRLVAANGLNGHPYTYNFTVVDVPMVNAFALPAGTVFVTAPLIVMAETEAELAGVIGHEIGHVKARHAAERMEAAKKESSKSWLFGAGGGLIGAAAGFGLGKLTCRKGDNACLAKATGLGAAAGIGGGLLVQKYKFMANSREDEMEADRIGFRTSVKAGYAPDHVGTFYAKLLQMEQQSKQNGNALVSSISDAMSTHPPSAERVQQMNQLASSTTKKPTAIISSVTFDRLKKKIDAMARSKPKA
jgi:beta-barrel assembly-enhancing protease